MRVTVCELPNDPAQFEPVWTALVAHTREASSQLVLLPEMPFGEWLARQPRFEPAAWQASLAAHDTWLARLAELAPAVVLGSRPVEQNGRRLNEAFAWDTGHGYRPAHHKRYLPQDEGFWESSWFQRGDGDFTPLPVGEALVGFTICTELWFFEHARLYGKQGIHLLAAPRATELQTVDKWLAGGRAAAVVSGAFCLSSNRAGPPGQPTPMGGLGWIIDPDGSVLARTSPETPFVTLEIDLQTARQAKGTYPRNVVT